MKISSYFSSQHDIKLPDEKKLLLYRRIQEQKAESHPHSLTKRVFSQKKLWYSLMSFGLIFVFFGTFFWDSIETTTYRAFLTHKIPNFNTTIADQVAKVLEINGEYVIEKDGKQFFNSVLFDGDLITLKTDAKILFNINDDAKIEITGPAQFSISKKAQGGYLLNLIDGNYLSIESEKATDEITIETANLSLKAEKSQNVNFKLSKSNDTFQIRNQGASLLITQKNNNQEKESTILSTAKMLTIQDNDISKIEDLSTFKKVVNGANITYTSNESVQKAPQTGTQSLETALVVLSNFTSGGVDSATNTEIINDLGYSTQDVKIPTESQLSQLTASLNRQFLTEEMKTLYTALFLADGTATQQSYTALSTKISTLAQTFEIAVKPTANNASIIQAIDVLTKGLEDYSLPPTKITQFKKLKNRLLELQTTPTVPWESFASELPQRLKFN